MIGGSWDLILQQRCQFSLALVCRRYMSKPTERQTLFFSSWEMVEQCFLSNKDLCSSCFISQHGPNKVHIGALKLVVFMTKCRGMLWQTNNYLAFSSWSSCNWTAVRCGNISCVVANVAFCFCAILKYEFWKNEEKINFLKQMCFSASGDSVCIGFFFLFFNVNESLKRNERRKEKVRMKLNYYSLSDVSQISYTSKFRWITWPWSGISKYQLPRFKAIKHCSPHSLLFLKIWIPFHMGVEAMLWNRVHRLELKIQLCYRLATWL